MSNEAYSSSLSLSTPAFPLSQIHKNTLLFYNRHFFSVTKTVFCFSIWGHVSIQVCAFESLKKQKIINKINKNWRLLLEM